MKKVMQAAGICIIVLAVGCETRTRPAPWACPASTVPSTRPASGPTQQVGTVNVTSVASEPASTDLASMFDSAEATVPTQFVTAKSATAASDDWPCFRGPNQAGVSAEIKLPVEWSDTKNLIWKTPLPGPGASSPVTFGDRIFVTCYSGYGVNRDAPGRPEDLQRHVVCLSRADGKILWNAKFSSQVPFDHYGDFTNQHGYASSTPAVDETGVYVYFGTWGARAYTLAGELKWEQSCGKQYFNYGSASSPVLFDKVVIINAAVEDRAIIALDKRSGREVWRVGSLLGFSYSTPLLVKQGSGHELVFPLGERYVGDQAQPSGLAAVDPSNGKKLWECTSLNVNLYPSPVTSEGIIYAIANRLVAIRAGGRGDVTETHLVWQIKEGSEVGSPVLYDGHLYWANEKGIACCVNIKNGDLVYKERLHPSAGTVYASGVIADGKLYYVSRENGMYVLEARPRYKLLAHNKFPSDGSVFNGTPAISHRQLLLRSDKHLYCIGQK